mmetsp:Transcript_27710/g.44384  ORF Transcript_27710/g.44384 Transcript_27710/m.44384 type:complete len:114 (-) Transcript_27710:433-774(-)
MGLPAPLLCRRLECTTTMRAWNGGTSGGAITIDPTVVTNAPVPVRHCRAQAAGVPPPAPARHRPGTAAEPPPSPSVATAVGLPMAATTIDGNYTDGGWLVDGSGRAAPPPVPA